MKQLGLYRLIPTAREDDPNWRIHCYQGAVLVRAYSPADARLAAAQSELDFMDTEARPAQGKSTQFTSAFRQSNLYTVVEEHSSRHPANGQRGLVEGKLRNPLKASGTA